MPNNVQDSGLVPQPQVQAMDSVTTVKHSLIVVNSPLPNPTPAQVNSNNHKKTLKKPKKQAGWLVDLSNNEPTSKVRLKSKPPSGKNNAAAAGVGGPLTAEPLEQEVSNVTEQEIDSSEEPSSIQDEIMNLEDEMTSATEVEIDQKPVKSNEISQQQREVTTTATATPTPPPSPSTTPSTTPPTINNKIVQQDLCFNYASILKFVKRGRCFSFPSIKWPFLNVIHSKMVWNSQCGNFIILLSLRFYVKSILGIIEVQNMPF